MRFEATDLPGVILVQPKIFGDDRGFFLETYQRERYAEAGIDLGFVQDNHSKSSRGVLRGLHLQLEKTQGKLIRVLSGEIYDVAVDVRVGSPHFGQHVAVRLSSENHHQLYVPPRFAHGFCVLSETAEVEYKCTDYYDPPSELSIRWDDPDLAIPWPIDSPQLSVKDSEALSLAEAESRLFRFEDS